MVKVTYMMFNSATGKVDLPGELELRDRMEAIRWHNCNRDYVRDVKFDGEKSA